MKKELSPKKQLGYGYFIAAVIFLVNPCINIIDILPDFFGYLFLMCGLSKWSDLYLNLRVAGAGLSKLRILMLIKMLSILLIPIVDDTWVLILTFVFTTLELVYLLPVIGRIFDSMDYFSTRFDGESPTVNVKNVRSFTYIFFVTKSLLTLIPEFCSLSDFEYSGYVTAGVQTDLADFKNLFILASIFFSVLIGILWLANIIPYINRIARDTAFLTRIICAYNTEIVPDRGLAIRRNTHKAITCLIAAFSFLPNLAFDEFNIIPNFMVGIFIIAACHYVKQLGKIPRILPISAATSTLISIVSFTLSIIFEAIHGIKTVRFRPDAFEAIAFYNVTRLISVIEYAVIAATVVILFVELKRIIPALLADSDGNPAAMYAVTAVKGKINGFFAAIQLAIIMNLVYTIVRIIIPAPLWAIPFFISVICVVCVASTLNRIYEKIEYKYI